jgi:hypothetical protein
MLLEEEWHVPHCSRCYEEGGGDGCRYQRADPLLTFAVIAGWIGLVVLAEYLMTAQ